MTEKIGPTGTYPDGKLGPLDEGGLNIGVGHDDDGMVVLSFGTKVAWIGMPPPNAIEFAKLILQHAGAKKVEVEL